MTYWFILGRQPELSTAELTAVLGLKNDNYTYCQNKILKISLKTIPENLIDQLGGTIKIAKELANNLDEKTLTEKIIQNLLKLEGKALFGLSLHSKNPEDLKWVKNLGIKIKKEIKSQNKSTRFLENKEKILSSATIVNNRLLNKGKEFLIEKNENNFNLAETISVQPLEELSKRDLDRPSSDSFSGMLPPKLALILINLASAKKTDVILDPFCGSGTILSECLLLKYKNIIGSDISEKAITDSEKNLAWTTTTYNLQPNTYNLINSDVKNLSQHIKSANTIITEPYLGKPLKGNEGEKFLKKQAEELAELYIKAFTEFKKILTPGGKIIFITPRFKNNNNWIEVKYLEQIKKLGFTPENLFENKKCLVYFRPGQKLAREIWRFKASY